MASALNNISSSDDPIPETYNALKLAYNRILEEKMFLEARVQGNEALAEIWADYEHEAEHWRRQHDAAREELEDLKRTHSELLLSSTLSEATPVKVPQLALPDTSHLNTLEASDSPVTSPRIAPKTARRHETISNEERTALYAMLDSVTLRSKSLAHEAAAMMMRNSTKAFTKPFYQTWLSFMYFRRKLAKATKAIEARKQRHAELQIAPQPSPVAAGASGGMASPTKPKNVTPGQSEISRMQLRMVTMLERNSQRRHQGAWFAAWKTAVQQRQRDRDKSARLQLLVRKTLSVGFSVRDALLALENASVRCGELADSEAEIFEFLSGHHPAAAASSAPAGSGNVGDGYSTVPRPDSNETEVS